MGVNLSRDRLVEIVGGEALPSSSQLDFAGVEFDSRQIKGGELFVALKGDNQHGHQYLDQALERGAALCLVEDRSLLQRKEHAERIVVVDDTLRAFGQLAKWWRDSLAVPIVAVTGSVGKTTVKELIAAILLKKDRGAYSPKSFNNQVGVPYTLCKIKREHKWAVVEIGMNHAGEIRQHVALASPNVALITKIAPVHTHVFANLDLLADAKCEILEGLVAGGCLVLNGDDQVLLKAVDRHARKGEFQISHFGFCQACQSRVMQIESSGLSGISVLLLLDGEELNIQMGVLGKHNALNTAAAVLAARRLFPDLPAAEIEDACRRFTPPRMRLNLRKISESRQIIDDSYNSNPVAMRALFELARDFMFQGKSVGFVVGDMLELGDHARRYHTEIAQELSELKPAFVIAVGEYASLFVEEAKRAQIKAFAAASPESAAHTASKLDFDILLVKASRGIGLDRTVETLLEVEGEMVPEGTFQ